MGGGIDGVVQSLAIDSSGNLYAGGWFTTAGGVDTNYITKWDGTTWSALGTGMDNEVDSIAVDGSGNLYAGGWFTSAGGASVNGTAKWNGNTWAYMGTGNGLGINDTVRTLAVDSSGNLYAGGDFRSAGGSAVNSIAKWDGTTWSALGSGMSGRVLSLAVDGSDNLYAGGWFTNAGGVVTNEIAKWDGTTWTAPGGIVDISDYGPHALAVDGSDNLYAARWFSVAGMVATKITKWDGMAWSAVGGDIDGAVNSMAVGGSGNLYAGGYFTTAGGVAANYITKWNGTAWSAVGTGMDHGVRALAMDGSGNLYAAGDFTTAGGVSANHIAKWNGTAWTPLGSGMDGAVNALAMDGNGNLYAAGDFTTAGGASANHIAKWNGTAWSTLGSGIDASSVNALAVTNAGDLYAGGRFATAGGKPSVDIAWWTAKSALAVDFSSKQGLYLLNWKGVWNQVNTVSPAQVTAWGTKLVAVFPGKGLYLYDGSFWKRLSTKSNVEAMLEIGNTLFIDFGMDGLFRYDGTMVQIDLSNPGKLARYGNKLVASFPGQGIFQHDGTAWTKLSNNGNVERMIGIHDRLYVDFGASGLHMYNGTWKRIRSANTDKIARFGNNLAVSFPGGLYLHDGKSWKQLTTNTATEDLIGIGSTLYVDRGMSGLYKYDTRWMRIHSSDASLMCSYAGGLACNFPGKGLYRYGKGKWTRLSTDTTAREMAGVSFP